jgi:hypothetical protein
MIAKCAIAGLAAAMALNCHPCTKPYIKECSAHDLDQIAIQDVLAKMMACGSRPEEHPIRYLAKPSGQW